MTQLQVHRLRAGTVLNLVEGGGSSSKSDMGFIEGRANGSNSSLSRATTSQLLQGLGQTGHSSAFGNASHCIDPKPKVSFLGYSGRLWTPQENRLQLPPAAEPSYLHCFTAGVILPKSLKEKILIWGGREGVKLL